MTYQFTYHRHFFWAFALFLIALKLLLVSDIEVHLRFSPFDDNVYVSRAYSFLTDGNWGSYDAYTLAKLPGMSYWLVSSRLLGIPYLLGINILYCFAGLLLIHAASNAGVSKQILLITYVVYLCNPVTFSIGWALVMREALSSVITVALLGVSLLILISPKNKLPFGWIFCWALLFSFCQLLREEDRLLWIFLIMFGCIAVWLRRDSASNKINYAFTIVLFTLPSMLTTFAGHFVRNHNETNYGAAILSDYNEGEFPMLMAAIRSIDSPVDNRLVMLSQEVIQVLRIHVPEFIPVLDRLPSPGFQTYSCKLQGVCSEWSNGWMPWWVKQASYDAGLTSSLAEGQAYFKMVRVHIEGLCGARILTCKPNGQGIIPPMELRWFRPFIHELSRITAMLISPNIELVSADSQTITAARVLIMKYQIVTMTNFIENRFLSDKNTDTLVTAQEGWRRSLALIDAFVIAVVIVLGSIALIWRWMMYPGVPASPVVNLCVVFWVYSVFKLLALSYVAVFFGPFESRIVFASHIGLSVLGIFVISDTIQAHHKFHSMRYFRA